MKKNQRQLKKDVNDDAGTSPSQEHDQSLLESGTDGTVKKDLYLDIVKALFEKYRDRVSTYYCSNLTCTTTFWQADKGYVCPQCGSFGIISEFNAEVAEHKSHAPHIIGCLDTIGRLICSRCMKNYKTDDDVGLIVYSDTHPYSEDTCDICRKDLRRVDNPAS